MSDDAPSPERDRGVLGTASPADGDLPARVPDAAIALERLLVRRRWYGSGLLSGDMYQRWGPKKGPEYKALRANMARISAEHQQVTAALDEAVARTRLTEPDAIAVWAEAHQHLLTRFIADHHPPESGTADPHAPARQVAAEERAEWAEVAAGLRPWVNENTYFVNIDPTLHAAWFGPIDPSQPA